MKNTINFIFLAVVLTASISVTSQADELSEERVLIKKAKNALAKEKVRTKNLQMIYDANEITLAKSDKALIKTYGILGEVFGITKSAAKSTYGSIESSIISAEYPERVKALKHIANTNPVPNLKNIEDYWLALKTEVTQSGRVSRFTADVTKADGSKTSKSIIRIGNFNLISEDGYLSYNQSRGTIQALTKDPGDDISDAAADFFEETSGFMPLYVDPSRDSL